MEGLRLQAVFMQGIGFRVFCADISSRGPKHSK